MSKRKATLIATGAALVAMAWLYMILDMLDLMKPANDSLLAGAFAMIGLITFVCTCAVNWPVTTKKNTKLYGE
jgi:hypothetical protein